MSESLKLREDLVRCSVEEDSVPNIELKQLILVRNDMELSFPLLWMAKVSRVCREDLRCKREMGEVGPRF
jgi:hypothetical protein